MPTFHGIGAGIFATDAKTGAVLEPGRRFARWLDEHPNRCWAMMMNYHPGVPIGPPGQQLFVRYRDRYLGSIAGESLGYFYPKAEEMRQATAGARTRRQLVEAFAPLTLRLNADKYRAVYGKDLDQNPYQDVISCLSVGNICYAPLSGEQRCQEPLLTKERQSCSGSPFGEASWSHQMVQRLGLEGTLRPHGRPEKAE